MKKELTLEEAKKILAEARIPLEANMITYLKEAQEHIVKAMTSTAKASGLVNGRLNNIYAYIRQAGAMIDSVIDSIERR